MILQLGHQILSNQPPRLFSNSDKIFRDFVYIDDVIQGNILAACPKKSGVYNIGTGNSRSFQEVSDLLQLNLGTDLGNEYFDNPYEGYQFHTKADITDSIEDLSFQPNFSLEQGIEDYLSEIKNTFGESSD